jgi:ABC-type bacteriocin/lantibiotic exporter with double-glycine peptidase domain
MQAYNFCSYAVWHMGAFALLAIGAAATLSCAITEAELVAFIMYNDHVAYSARTVCVQIAHALQNVGSVEQVLR